MSDSKLYIGQLKRKYVALKGGEVLLWSIAAASLVYGITNYFTDDVTLKALLTVLGGISVLMIRVIQLQLLHINDSRIISYINNRYAVLEESADLLLKPNNTLTLLQLIQKERVSARLMEIYPAIKIPNRLRQSLLLAVISIAITFGLTSFKLSTGNNLATDDEQHASKALPQQPLPANIKNIEIRIAPPAYMNQKDIVTSNPSLEIPEGSTVTWSIQFNDEIQDGWIVLTGDSIKMSKQKQYVTKKSFISSTFYQVVWRSENELKASDFYKIEITSDKAPEIAIHNLPQFNEFEYGNKLNLAVNSTIVDDYGLQNAYIIATVSKGSGESVKFREERLKFTSPKAIAGKSVQASTVIDLLKLGMEPGDELYFYVEALDNKVPSPNRARTETFFVLLQDTTKEEVSIEGGLGVDLMPEYFRSQRQIIIDSEKLLKEKRSISKQEFNSRSNELGYDQKVLRLKYGEFLGEEFESGIGPAESLPTEEDDHDHEEEDITKKYGHVHDTENEHNLVPEKKGETHSHSHNTKDGEADENPMNAFLHVHDDPEEATFFSQSIRAKLKAALTVMWDAELHLRLYDPEKSLPYQYKALKLLKEISNDSRIYVHKTGFDPPPIKEDKRLAGDLSEIKSSRDNKTLSKNASYPSIRKALVLTEALLSTKEMKITENDKALLLQAGTTLSSLALANPGQYLRALSLIKSINDNEVAPEKLRSSLQEIQKDLWKAFPKNTSSPTQPAHVVHALNQSFIKNLEASKNE
ncbi:DUF4175 family protein [Chryseosolibacter indicus]|uniref:Tryptophan-rich sensory protein n=1 Tax=Chryseosolibacter indicus TaxID=2782351 RepID=A0ABS5VLV4_9BACT|nr:DUF4175 family protein [Chryseosolibacter indicus]MBT1702351.1 hypothetical protein [Chryseosolibacter indicus]